MISMATVITLGKGGLAGSLLQRLMVTTTTDRGATGIQELATARLLLKGLTSKHCSVVDSEAGSYTYSLCFGEHTMATASGNIS